MYVVIAVAALAFGAKPFDVFVWSGVIGTLILLFVYILATIGAMKLLFFSGPAKVAAWQIVIPIGALLVLGYTIYRNVWPYPAMHGDDGSIERVLLPADRLRDLDRAVGPVGPGAARRGASRRREAHGRGGPLARHGHHGVRRGTGARAGSRRPSTSCRWSTTTSTARSGSRSTAPRSSGRSPSPIARWRRGRRRSTRSSGSRSCAGARRCSGSHRTPSPDEYLARRAELGPEETNRRLLGPSGVVALPGRHGLRDRRPARPGGDGRRPPGSRARDRPAGVGRRGGRGVRVDADGFAAAFLERLAARIEAGAVGTKSIVAYRHGFDLDPAPAGARRGRAGGVGAGSRGATRAPRRPDAAAPRALVGGRCAASRCRFTSGSATRTCTCTGEPAAADRLHPAD